MNSSETSKLMSTRKPYSGINFVNLLIFNLILSDMELLIYNTNCCCYLPTSMTLASGGGVRYCLQVSLLLYTSVLLLGTFSGIHLINDTKSVDLTF